MNIVLSPAESALLDILEQRIIKYYGGRGKAYEGYHWIIEDSIKIQIYYEEKRGEDLSFVNFIDEDLVIESSGYRRYWRVTSP